MHLPAGMEWIIILGIILLLFGPTKLPQLAKGLGQSVKEFKDAARSEEEKAKVEAKPADKPEGPKGV